MVLKNVKKFVFSLLVFVLIVSFASEPVNAKTSTQNETLNEKSTKVNIDEKGIPEEVKELAKSQYLPRVAALDRLSEKKESSYILGEPFKIYKFNYKSDGNYYFPVLDKEDNVVYVVTISQKIEKDKTASQSGKYTVNVSPFLARILNQYENQKITILTNTKGYFVLTENDEIKPVLKTPLTNENQFESTKLEVQKQYINKLKNFKIRETQGNNGWCAGYTMSALLNATYNTDRYNAKAMMRYLHPNLQGEAFQFTGLTPQEMMRFGQSQNRQVEFLNRMPSYNEIDNLTKSNKGIAILGRRIESTNGIHAGHSMAVVGNAKLENGQEVIIIWNPWDHGFMTQDAKSNITPASNGDHYNWNSSIYGY